MVRYAKRMELIDTENAFKVGPYIGEVEDSGRRVIKCNLGEPDFETPRHIREEIKRQLDLDNGHYCDPQGILSLREAVARQLSSTRRVEITPARVVIFPGAKPPIGFCQEAYTDPGDEVVYPSPGFPIYESFIGYVGAVPVPLHLAQDRGFAFTGEDLLPLLTERTRLIYLNFPSNPTGGVATRDQIEGIARVILEKAPEARVYSDEVYENIVFDGKSHHSIASVPGMAERTIIVSGVSKSYSFTGGRIGWAAFPTEDEAAVFKNLNINYFSCVPPFIQEGARHALEAKESLSAIAEMVAAFEKRRDAVVAGLNSISGIQCETPAGAFYVFPNIGGCCREVGACDAHERLAPDLKAKTSPSTLFQMFLLFRYAVATMDRKSFGRLGAEGKHYLRISIATGLPDLEEAVRRIKQAASDRTGFEEFVSDGKRLY